MHQPAALQSPGTAQRDFCGVGPTTTSTAAAKATVGYLRHFTLWRVVHWLRRRHTRANWKQLRRRYLGSEWWPKEGREVLFDPSAVAITRYRYRATNIPTPWSTKTIGVA